jgi:hypothetical protein
MPPKKPEVKDDTLNKLIFAFLGIFLLWVLIQRLFVVLNYYFSGGYDSLWQRTEVYFLQYIWPLIKMAATIITVAGIYGIYKIVRATMQIREEERLVYGSTEVGVDEMEAPGGSPKNEKWEQVQTHINSKNPSEWRLAIIEADIMLDELLKASGYHGDTVGERLKAVEPSDFTSLEAAWEAHKVRNQIAHQGSGFEINEREAKRVINLFETVFREFNII